LSCDRSGSSKKEENNPAHLSLLEQGKEALSQGDFAKAISLFSEVETRFPSQKCEAHYGLALGYILKEIYELNKLIQLAQTAQDLSGFAPQDTDLKQIIKGFIDPLELPLRKIAQYATLPMEEGCPFDLPKGLPIVVGEKGKTIYLKVLLGYTFNEPFARTLTTISNGILAGWDFLFSHSLVISEDMSEAITYVTGVQRLMQKAVTDPYSGSASEYTYITLLRALGVIFAFNPKLLLFDQNPNEQQRFLRVDNEILSALSAIYTTSSRGERGIIPALLSESKRITDPSSYVIALKENGDGVLGAGDTLIIGIRELRASNEIALVDLRGGLQITLPESLGDIPEAIRNLHEIVKIVGDQMSAVESGGAPSRLTLTPVNGIIRSLTPLKNCIDPLPEAVEWDLKAFFVDAPVPIRNLLPFYSSEFTGFTPVEFVIEGESSIPRPDPFVFRGDTEHFPNSLLWEGGFVNPHIGIDRVSPPEKFDQPFPYVAWQDPDFHGVLYLIPALLPFADPGAPREPVLADWYLVNKGTNGYLLWALDHIHCGVTLP